MKRCLYAYGYKRQFRCKRLLGHWGPHAQRPSLGELAHMVMRKITL